MILCSVTITIRKFGGAVQCIVLIPARLGGGYLNHFRVYGHNTGYSTTALPLPHLLYEKLEGAKGELRLMVGQEPRDDMIPTA
jgi:hypothetical protein